MPWALRSSSSSCNVTPGFTDPKLTAESVRDNFEAIRNEDGYKVPANLTEELMLGLEALG